MGPCYTKSEVTPITLRANRLFSVMTCSRTSHPIHSSPALIPKIFWEVDGSLWNLWGGLAVPHGQKGGSVLVLQQGRLYKKGLAGHSHFHTASPHTIAPAGPSLLKVKPCQETAPPPKVLPMFSASQSLTKSKGLSLCPPWQLQAVPYWGRDWLSCTHIVCHCPL